MSLFHTLCAQASPSRIALMAAILALCCASSSAQQPKVLAPHRPVAPKLEQRFKWDKPAVRQSATGGLWMIDANMKASLYLKNVLKTGRLTVTPVLYLSNGVRYPLSAVMLEPSGTAILDINQGLAKQGIAPYAQLYGYAEIEYQWPWAAVTATIRNVDPVNSLIFIFALQPPPDTVPQSAAPEGAQTVRSLEGAWWKQEKNVSGFLALANVTSQTINATLRVTDSKNALLKSDQVAIAPHGTKMLSLNELQSAPSDVGGIYLSHDGPDHALAINAGLDDQAVGYSAHLLLLPSLQPASDPASDASPASPTEISFAELGLMNGAADPMMNFPSGTVFTPYSVVRNISDQPATVTPSLWWMAGGAAKSAQLPTIVVAPHRTVNLNPAALIAMAGLKNFNGSLNLVLDTKAQSGAVVPSAGSVDQKNTYVFEVTPHGVAESASKALCYWSTGDGDDTMVTLWNPADEGQDLVFTLFFSGGHYAYPIPLPARATRTFNISEILHSSIPDAEGNVIPAGVHEGSAEIAGQQGEHQHVLVSLDSGTYNVRKAVCGVTCVSCNGVTGENIAANPFSVAVGGNKQQTFYMTWNTGGQYSLNSHSNWGSNKTTVATVSGGMIHGVAAGSATISAVDTEAEPQYIPSYCTPAPVCPINLTVSAAGSGTVQVPTASRITKTVSSNSLGSGISPCASGQAGWYRQVQKIITDQTGADIVLAGQNLSETITIGTPNNLGITGTVTGTAVTSATGTFQDTFFVCSPACPANSGQTNATQMITDTLPSGAGPYSLSQNALVYKCSSITVNAQ